MHAWGPAQSTNPGELEEAPLSLVSARQVFSEACDCALRVIQLEQQVEAHLDGVRGEGQCRFARAFVFKCSVVWGVETGLIAKE